ncbi:20S-pre-rRNA D-site endonuclease nob1, variant 2 [Entomophthora muscae]|uniref:20S-pre-rRNA D-site endonuclease nob1, variant 2 n=1 Tax=Entomophthora muscae TaxID=34485 RepID=A0ACC2UPL7_9FUNG|nr:20S-pre-rRNA D-site endonuclease nob1, variant 2 [Entomophthora muscae]
MLEKEKCGIEYLRKEPAKAQVQLGSKSPEQLKAERASAETKGINEVDPELSNSKEEEASEAVISEELEKLTVSDKEPCSSDVLAENEESEDDVSDSDDGDWITPSNLKEKQLESMGHLKKGETKVEMRKVGCITTDYAMQSVILQMNLALVSVEGMMIKDLRSFVLRCHACFKYQPMLRFIDMYFRITANLTKQFCPSCGGPTLIRTSCSVDQDGNVKYYLKKNFRHNLRGIKYSIPNPKGGHKNTDLILREDTKEYERAMKNYNHRKETNLFDPDYLPGILTGKHLPNTLPPTIGFGRKNPNQARRCKGRKKS